MNLVAPEFDPKRDHRELLRPGQQAGHADYVEQDRVVFGWSESNTRYEKAWWLYATVPPLLEGQEPRLYENILRDRPFPWSINPDLPGHGPLLEEMERPFWDQQVRAYGYIRDRAYSALFMEQRTGKSGPVVKKAARHYLRDEIDALLVFAPNGVHANWATESIAEFLPRRIPNAMCVWRSGKMSTKSAQEGLERLLKTKSLAVLCVAWDALRTPTLKKYLAKFLRRRRIMVVGDEVDDISTPGAKRTITAIAAAKWAKYKVILTGTPAAESPFSLYAECNFLAFGLLGFTSHIAFMHHHGEYERDEAGDIVKQRRRDGHEYEEILRDEEGRPRYRNLPELHSKLSRFSFFCTREECGGQIPLLSRRLFELEGEQRDAYDTLREQFIAEITRQSGTVTARMVLVRYARLQQIASGYVPLDREPVDCLVCGGTDVACPRCDGLGVVLPPPVMAKFSNPRLDALERELRGVKGQVVVWTRFNLDGDVVVGHLRAQGRRVGRYDRMVSAEDREAAKLAFQRGELDAMVASPQAGGRGLDFSRARTAIFYSHHWSLRLRLQAQDRVENLAKRDPVCLVNLVAEDTVDELITECHAAKREVQDVITGRQQRKLALI